MAEMRTVDDRRDVIVLAAAVATVARMAARRCHVARMVAVTAFTVTCGSFAACDDNTKGPSNRSWTSAHFDYRTRADDDKICPDVLGPLEEHFALLQGYLGFAWPAGRKVTYHKFRDSADFEANAGCGPGFGGCAQGASLNSANALDPHELVHAYLAGVGSPPPVLVEGVAVVLSCDSDTFGTPKPTLTWDQLASLTATSDSGLSAYSAGAWLVGYLLDLYGPQKFLDLYSTFPNTGDAAAMDAAVQRVYGDGLAALWASALSDAQPRNNCLWQCSHPALALDGVPFDATAGTCGLDTFRVFTLPAAATLSFSAKGPAFELGPCGPFTPPRDILNGGSAGGLLALYDLPAGSYFLQFSPTLGTITPTGDASALLNPECAKATDVAALDVPNVAVAVRATSPRWFLPLRAPLPDGKPPFVIPVDTQTTVTICQSCDPASCDDPSLANEWIPGEVLNIATDPNVSFSRFIFSWY